MEGIFYKNVDDYNDPLEPLRHYREQTSLLIMRLTGCTQEEADRKSKNIIRERFKDREMTFILKKENGDSTLMKTGVINYLNTHVKAGNVIVPSFTTYLPASTKQSLWSNYTKRNVAKRAVDKREAQQAESNKNYELANFKNTSQSNQKTKNNALSGLFISPASVVVNPTAHSALTSMTRTMTSLTNANNERLINGNRALLTPRCVLNSVINEARYCNKEAIRDVINQYNLHVPTVEEVVSILKYSSDLYNRDGHYYRKNVIPVLEKLTPEELCGIAYSQDFYHLWTYNEELMYNLFKEMIETDEGHTEKMEDPTIISKLDQGIVYYVHGLLANKVRGFGKDYKKMNDAGIASDVYHTCLKAINFFRKHKVFFNAFILNDICPINSHQMHYVRRRSVPLSDTDSSGFSNDVPVMKFINKHSNNLGESIAEFMMHFRVTDMGVGLACALTFISSENVVHQLSRLSKYMNVDKNELRRLSMKNEWFWSVFTPTDATKHYYAEANIQEGNVFEKAKMEIKGVHLKTSNVPEEILDEGYRLMEEFSQGIRLNKPITLEYFIQEAIKIENSIITSLRKGETKYLGTVNINGPDSYNGPKERSPYRHHIFWMDVFEDKYGKLEEPPYVTVKLPLNLSNPTALKEWVATIPDLGVRKRFETWATKYKRRDFNTVYINADFVRSNGFPDELQSCLDVNRVVLAMTKQLRIVLTTFGIVLQEGLLIQEQLII